MNASEDVGAFVYPVVLGDDVKKVWRERSTSTLPALHSVGGQLGADIHVGCQNLGFDQLSSNVFAELLEVTPKWRRC